MKINKVSDFKADQASFDFSDDQGNAWKGRCDEYKNKRDQVHISGTIRKGPKGWRDRRISLIYSQTNQSLIIN